MLIYQLTNLATGLSYIGKTGKTLEGRWIQHCADARNGSKNYLHRAIEKYGHDWFLREVVCECPEDEGNLWERFCIVAFGSRAPHGYNMTDGGDGVPGYVFTEEDRKKLGSGLRGKKRPPRSEEWIEKIRTAAINQKLDPVYMEKLRAGCRRNAAENPEWRQKLIADGARRAADPEWHKKVSDGIKKAFQNPEIKARHTAAMTKRSGDGWAEKMAARSANPEWITKQKDGSRRRSENPQWRERCRKGQKLRRDRERFERLLINAPAEYLQPLQY
jgi:group I intron endonuclease